MRRPDESSADVEDQIDAWRAHVARRAAIGGSDEHGDVEELESHLRDSIDGLRGRGLSADEAFLVAVRRLGAVDALSHEFAREHSDRLWRQLVLSGETTHAHASGIWLAFACALGSAVLLKSVLLLSAPLGHRTFADAGLVVLAALAGYFLIRRRADAMTITAVAGILGASAVLVNAYPFAPGGMTLPLQALHLAVVGWASVGLAYTGARWRAREARMDFLRFTGEWVIYLTLIWLGGGVLLGLTVAILGGLGAAGITGTVIPWAAPFGAAGSTVIAAWLVEAKQSLVENLAPVLTRVFTPLFTVLLVVLVPVTTVSLGTAQLERSLLIAVNALLIVVVALVLYAVSARTPAAAPDWLDRFQLVLVAAAVVLDAILLSAILLRIGEYGITANKLATLGLNVLLLGNLVVSLLLQARFVAGRSRFAGVGSWQTAYLPVWVGWAAVVAVVVPPAFGFA